ncbi:MAG: cellulase family glycosylhydrolase [Oscillospiraceae bacterium]|nr:cellulase family glycosylhydrolase [Oscillospiraceae bacterium]
MVATPSPTPDGTPADTPPPTAEPDPDPVLAPVPQPDVMMNFNEDINAFELAVDMGAGWNLGNTLDAVLGRNSPVSISIQETSWGNPVTTREMVELLSKSGFNSLRIPITWSRFVGEAPDYILNTDILDRVQEIVDWAFEFDMYVIVNTHHEYFIPHECSQGNDCRTWLFPDDEHRELAARIITALWHQVASRFAGYSEKLLFENLNEPRLVGTNYEWSGGTTAARGVLNYWNQVFIKTIRNTGYHNENRFLLLPTYAASADPAPIADMWVPRNDDRIFVSVHAYTPYNLVLAYRGAHADTTVFHPDDPDYGRWTGDIDALFDRLDKTFISQGTAVIMGETGMLNKHDNHEDRARWADYYTSKAAEIGIPCFWWDNGIKGPITNNEGFGLMNRQEAVWHFPEIAAAFVKNQG